MRLSSCIWRNASTSVAPEPHSIGRGCLAIALILGRVCVGHSAYGTMVARHAPWLRGSLGATLQGCASGREGPSQGRLYSRRVLQGRQRPSLDSIHVHRPHVLMTRHDDLARIREALEAAAQAVKPFTPGDVAFDEKSSRGDPVTEADLAINDVLHRILPRPGEGWLSEETRDNAERLGHRRVWVVDPLDGTREFVDGVPEWCISVGLVEDGVPVAGGIYSPPGDLLVVGSVETGVTHNGRPAGMTARRSLEGATILASRSEWKRGEWERYARASFQVIPCGSVAFKLAQVAVGMADGTWTLVPKHEWDVAAGAALVSAAGGALLHADGSTPRWNQPSPKLPNFLAARAELLEEFRRKWVG